MKQIYVFIGLIFAIVSMPTVIAGASSEGISYCSKKAAALAVAKAILSEWAHMKVDGEGILIDAKSDGDFWRVVWSNPKILDGRARLDIDMKNCGLKKYFPQYDGS